MKIGYNEPPLLKRYTKWHWYAMLLVLIAGIAWMIYVSEDYGLGYAAALASLVVFLVEISILAIWKHPSNEKLLCKWTAMHGYNYYKDNNHERVADRKQKNPNKKMLSGTMRKEARALFVSGQHPVSHRNFWLFNGSYITSSLRIGENVVNWGWCFEIACNNFRSHVLIAKKYISSRDTLDTESNVFEEIYKVQHSDNIDVLQLLDPVLIEKIIKSNIALIEFSDSSILIYYPASVLSETTLDMFLEITNSLAEQVDRNFPMGKYEKK